MEDLQGWEIVSHDEEDAAIILTEHVESSSITTLFNMNHFILPSSESTQIVRNSVMLNQMHNHEALGEVMKENILQAASLSNTEMESEDTKQQDANIKEDDRKNNVLQETNSANKLCKKTLGGLLAICSFAAAAIICIVFLGKRWPHDQRLRLQIYTGNSKVCE